jgi:hypothetical protein
VSGQLHVPPALPPEKGPPVPIGNEAGWPQSWSGRRREEKFLYPTGTRNPALGRPARSKSLYRLHYPPSYFSALVRLNLQQYMLYYMTMVRR